MDIVFIALVICAAIFSSTKALVNQFLGQQLGNPLMTTSVVLASASLITLPFFIWKGLNTSLIIDHGRSIGLAALFEMCGYALYFASLKIGNVTISEPISYLQAVFAAIFGVFVIGENSSIGLWGGTLCSVLGAIMISRGSSNKTASASQTGRISSALLAIGAAFSWALGNLIIAPILGSEPSIEITTVRTSFLLIGSVLVLFFMRRSFVIRLKNLKSSILFLFTALLNGLLYVLIVFCLLSSISRKGLASTYSLFNISAFLSLITYLIGSKLWPTVFRPIENTVFLKRFAGSVLVWIGVGLILFY